MVVGRCRKENLKLPSVKGAIGNGISSRSSKMIHILGNVREMAPEIHLPDFSRIVDFESLFLY